MVKRGRFRTGRIARQGEIRRSEVSLNSVVNRSLDDVLFSVERREIIAALLRAAGQRTKAAELLGISRSRLYRRMEALGIEQNEVLSNGHL